MAASVLIGVASLIHVYIFAMESLLWGTPRTNKVFRVNAETAEQNRLFAFNQGFYNLFLAMAGATGIVLYYCSESVLIGKTLMVYAAASMLGAALVLVYSQRKLWRAALIQGGPPFMGLVALVLTCSCG